MHMYFHVLGCYHVNNTSLYAHIPVVGTVLFELDLDKLSKPAAVVVSHSPRITKCLQQPKSTTTSKERRREGEREKESLLEYS